MQTRREKQRWVYKRYDFYTRQLERAQRLIKDEDARNAVDYRYIQGYSLKETTLSSGAPSVTALSNEKSMRDWRESQILEAYRLF